MSDAAPAIVTLEPEPGSWSLPDGEIDEASARFRSQLGLPTDRRIVMTGHQAAFWHAGILAKYAAAGAMERHTGAHVAWLVVDQDGNDPLEIRCPVRGEEGVLDVSTLVLGEGAGPTGWRPPVLDARTPHVAYATEEVASGVQSMVRAMRAHEDEASLAGQVSAAVADLLAPLDLRGTRVFASRIAETDVFGAVVERMAEDPAACARAYNEAVAAGPDVGLRALEIGDRVELPLWRIEGGQRRPAHADELDGEVVPRALLMTGLMRLHAGELFVHGTGAAGAHGQGGYEQVGNDWLQRWLGVTPRARIGVASATMTLELADGREISEEDVAAAKARAHKARHDPALIGDGETAARKRSIVERISAAKEAGEKPGALFQEMQSLLDDYRSRRASDFEALDREAEAMERRLAEGPIREDRTWAFPLHGMDRLRDLVHRIDGAFGPRA